MGEKLQGRLDPKIKAVWRISDALGIVIVFAVALGLELIPWAVDPSTRVVMGPLLAITAGMGVVFFVVFMAVVTPLRYARWRYRLEPEFLEIQKGIVWRTHTVVPFIRVQNTDTKQGPILRLFGLASVTVSTAAGAMEIPGLGAGEADALRDRAAEFARIAREDV